MTMFRAMTATLILLASAGCEKTSQPTTPPPANDSGAVPATDDGAVAEAEDTEPGAPGVAWADKTFDQKKTWMGVEVFPTMKASFQAHDGNAFKKFTCDTCHGEDGKANGYKMPSDSIYPLDPKDPVTGAMEYDEEITQYMIDKVVPEMVGMLEGVEAYSPENPTGFGCMSCHPAA